MESPQEASSEEKPPPQPSLSVSASASGSASASESEEERGENAKSVDVEAKLECLREEIAKRGKLLVAFSGGLDSGFLLKVACDVLSCEKVLAVTLDAEVFPRSEKVFARELAEEIGVRHKFVKFAWLSRKRLVENLPERCFFCKLAFTRLLKEVAAEEGFETIADGVTTSDLGRPGVKASEGIWHPLAEASLSKEDVRNLARMLKLPFWKKPSMSCLATRIPYGMHISAELLQRIEEAEEFLRESGFERVRVRVHSASHSSNSQPAMLLARIEVGKEELSKFNSEIMTEVCEHLKRLGFYFVTLDLAGYQSGSMDSLHTAAVRRRDAI